MANAKKSTASAPKKRLLRLDSSKQTEKLNASKQIDEVVYYSLADVETVVQAVLSELSTDPTVGVALVPYEKGVKLNCVPAEGDEYEVEVELESEDGAVEDEESETVEESEEE